MVVPRHGIKPSKSKTTRFSSENTEVWALDDLIDRLETDAPSRARPVAAHVKRASHTHVVSTVDVTDWNTSLVWVQGNEPNVWHRANAWQKNAYNEIDFDTPDIDRELYKDQHVYVQDVHENGNRGKKWSIVFQAYPNGTEKPRMGDIPKMPSVYFVSGKLSMRVLQAPARDLPEHPGVPSNPRGIADSVDWGEVTDGEEEDETEEKEERGKAVATWIVHFKTLDLPTPRGALLPSKFEEAYADHRRKNPRLPPAPL